jgi:transcriptional repressor of dcmA and dcmR
MNDPNELLDIGQAAKLLNVSETSLRRWTNSGQLRCMRVGQRRERRFRREDLLAFLEGQPSSVNPAVAAPGRTPEPSSVPMTITHGSHLCGIYSTDLGLMTLAVPFLLDGLNEGSICILLGRPALRREVVKYVKKKRPRLQTDIDAERLILVSYNDSPDEQWEYYIRLINERIAAGVQSFRVLGDAWSMRSQLTEESFLDYESGYDRLIAQRNPVVTLCVYDARRFSGTELLQALKGHRDTFRYPLERALA